ncbi:MAG TPA: alpha/beta hydrolase [Mucilaginibacter sp.]
MTNHYFENALVKLHYYKFGTGAKKMLCFHGFGMHGRQFKALESALGAKYTFYGFDLFFHNDTKLKDQSLQNIKKGLGKEELTNLIIEFCVHEHIDRFSIIAYSMGSHYATTVVEDLAPRIDEYIVAAPSSINPGKLIKYFSKNKTGNKILEKLVLSENILIRMLHLFKRLRFIDDIGLNILLKEINTPELRFNLYACFTYLRFLQTNEPKLINALNANPVKCIFIFGKRDKMYPPNIGTAFFKKLNHTEVVVLDENHEMINQNFVSALSGLLL